MSLEDLGSVWVSELIFAVDVETMKILDVTGDVEACLGSSPSQLVGLPLFVAVHRDDIDEANAAFQRTVEEGRATWEGRVRRVDGEFVRYGWEGRLGIDGTTIYARSRDVERARIAIAEFRVFERLADLTADLMLVVDSAGLIIQANQAAKDTYDWEGQCIVGSPLTDYVVDERLLTQFARRLKAGDSIIEFQVPSLTGDGRELIMEGTATFDFVTNRWYVVERDVTERVEREQELEITRRFFDLSGSQLVLVDRDNRVVRANRSFLEVAEWEVEDVVGLDILDALRVVGGADVTALLASARRGESEGVNEIRVRVDGAPRRFEVELSAAVDGGAVYLSCRDVTEERSLQAELRRRASCDPLTGLANRPAVLEAIESDLASGEHVVVIMLDLDGFKKVNDTLGHAAGDELLVRIAQRLDRRTRATDIVARMGGDEFIVLPRGIPDAATIEVVGEKIRQAFLEPFEVQGRPVEILAAVGATGGHRTSHTSQELLLEADLAAYSAKHAGSGECRIFDAELRDQADFASAVEEHLRRVLSAAEFALEVVELTHCDDDQVGLGIVAPAVAISGERRWNSESLRIAKNLGLLGAISARMTEEAVRRLAPWLRADRQRYLEIVFSLSEVSIGGFDLMLMGVLADHGVDPAQFVVGISDHGDVDAGAFDPDVIASLRAAGVRVALSDSFADAQTLSILSNVGLDRIDVDLAHVAATEEGSVKRLITNTVLDIADRLGITVLVDASFTPDLIDIDKVFRGSEPTRVLSAAPVPMEDFLDESAAGQPQIEQVARTTE